MRKCQKRPIYIWQKRPIEISISEVCVSVKRDLFIGKRGLYIWHKRPIEISISEVCVRIVTCLYG